MAFINGKEVMFSMQTPIANETGDSETMAISQKAATEELNKKAEKITNETEFQVVRVINPKSDTEKVITLSQGIGGGCVVQRENGGQIRSSEAKEDYHVPPLSQVNNLLGGISQSTIHGDEIAKGGSLAAAIKSTDFGLFVIKGEDVTVTYTAQGEADNEVRSIKSDFHFIIKWKLANGTNKILHLHLTSALQGYIKSFDGIIKTNIDVANGSTQYGARVIKMNMKAVT